ncbi:Conserved_hypothetical protein [Hexamita inflata]|uniref:Uncharacterized protein n=1 Tax=Hexamita inflata TaxID=28002 RepID=A0AA86UZP0_9EUKA|nr:Conserved hypothetical protein [Hexamita inflata]
MTCLDGNPYEFFQATCDLSCSVLCTDYSGVGGVTGDYCCDDFISKGLNLVAKIIVGACVGGGLFLLLMIVSCYFCCCRPRKQQQQTIIVSGGQQPIMQQAGVPMMQQQQFGQPMMQQQQFGQPMMNQPNQVMMPSQ